VNIATTTPLGRFQLTGSSRFTRTLPSLAALGYPGLIWCGTAVGPAFLLISLVVPLMGLLVGHNVDHHRYPRSRWIAFAAAGTPPLYSLLGGWLDFQHAMPFKGLHVWMLIWLVSVCIVFWERPLHGQTEASRPAQRRRLAFAHGVSAVLIACFAAVHLANHVGGLWGGTAHIAIMHALRPVYRNPVVETVLLGSITFQVISGLLLLKRKLPHASNWIDSLQAASAIYLVLFFLSHLSAVLRARYLRHIDTNWTWLTADGLLTDPWSARLAPYYFLVVIALAVHGGAGVRTVMLAHGGTKQRADTTFYLVIAGALLLSASIMTALIRG